MSEHTFVTNVETNGRLTNVETQQSFVPGLSSVPSSFRKAKPRVYRNRFTPADAARRQTECNVVTTGSSETTDSSAVERSNQTGMSRAVGLNTSNGRPHTGFGYQEKVAVVSLAELEDESVLMLDFHAAARRHRQLTPPNHASESTAKNEAAHCSVRFVAWTDLSDSHRRLELMAATKSRCVQNAAAKDATSIPSLEDFENRDVKVQLSVHAFSRWFSAIHNHHQWIRERFLLEELAFAAGDLEVYTEMASQGILVPSLECIGMPTSKEWREFVLWYSGDNGEAPLNKERLESRARYLKHRLRVVREVEQKLIERRRAVDDALAERVFVFEDFSWTLSNESEDVMAWEKASLANQEKEVALALLDPDIQIAAMMDEIELPDLSGVILEDCDLLAFAERFVPWWAAAGNKARLDFLSREVEEAAAHTSIQEMLSCELGDGEVYVEISSEDFSKSYFESDQARHTFLKRKLFDMKRKSRIASVAQYGKAPAPIVFETLPQPLSVAFHFPEIDAAEVNVVVQDAVSENNREQIVTSKEHSMGDDVVAQPGLDDMSRLSVEDELRLAALELELMLVEDELSRDFNAQMMDADSDDDDGGKTLTPPKRTDFSRSYFFGNLPQRFRLPSRNWQSGSGIDNGDEEIEEEERLEQERERQRLLDQQEAERIAEEERKAERARLEKEKDDKALQMRRVRQLELRKVLIYQSELETKRREEREAHHVLDKMRRIRDEEAKERARLERMASEQARMAREDQLSAQVRKELRDVVVQAKRRELNELALMGLEDTRSALVQNELKARERGENERRTYLAELYTSFEPYFSLSKEPSEEFLPSIQRRCMERDERRRRARLKTALYTVPYAESLVMDEIDQEPYVARDSRKFNLLMGLPVRSSHSRKRSHLLKEADISRLHTSCTLLDNSGERIETPPHHSPVLSTSSASALPALKSLHHRPKSKVRHKDPTSWKASCGAPTDFSSLEAREPCSKTTAPENNNQRPQAALPFFKGNMVVRGESKHARSNDYSYRS